jgi:hypothetical protein
MPKVLLAVVAAAIAGVVHAQPIVVEAVQYPAWLERGGNAVPLMPGTALQAQDQIRTGENARVQLKLAEGSSVKLGEKVHYTVERLEPRGVFAMTMSVLRGAFRFTTDALRKSARRDVQIKVKNVTAGIRGTDVWGKSEGDTDLVCLLEGAVTVGSEGHPTVTLDQPLDFYRKRATEGPVVAKVDAEKVKQWAKETEIAADGAVGRPGGRWRVIAAVLPNRDQALALNRDVRAGGYPSQVGADAKAGTFYVFVPGLAGESEARALMANLRSIRGVSMPSVNQTP